MLKMKSLVMSALLLGASGMASADIHFIIPGGPGGGWDTTARGVGEALVKSKIDGNASFENLSGGGGGRAIASMIKSKTNRAIFYWLTRLRLCSVHFLGKSRLVIVI